jgi:hypothetical protein
MRRYAVAILIFITVSFSASAVEDMSSGNYYYNLCQNAKKQENLTFEDALKIGECVGFVNALYSLKSVFAFCPSFEVTIQQINDIYLNYLEKHPTIRHRDGGALFILAMQQAFPCPASKK